MCLMSSKRKSCDCEGSSSCEKCKKKEKTRVYMNEYGNVGMEKFVLKLNEPCVQNCYCGKEECICCEDLCFNRGCGCVEKCTCGKKKGMEMCKKKFDYKCFKHCAPISQVCDGCFYNHFTNRANLGFGGLVVVKNTGNPSTGCMMKVCVRDSCGTEVVAKIHPGSSVPVFVEGLTLLEIACYQQKDECSCSGICTGEVIFDLEYCTVKYIEDHCY